MKYLKTTLPILFACLVLLSGKLLVKHKTAPPGTVWLKDNLYIDICPIRNKDYLEFLNFSKTYNWEKCFSEFKVPGYGLNWDSSSSVFRNYPSDAKFLKRFEPADSVIEIYSNDILKKSSVNPFRYTEYNSYPMVNIGYEQAMKFCVWRENMIQYYMAIDSKTEQERNKKYYSKLKFRLPSKEEWEFAAKNFFGKKKIGKRVFKDHTPLTLPSENEKKFTVRPYSITEMLKDKGKAIGLSYKDIALTDPFIMQNYEGPQTWVGFRCVCEVEE